MSDTSSEIKTVLGNLQTGIAGFNEKFAGLNERFTELQTQVDAIDMQRQRVPLAVGEDTTPLEKALKENESVQRLISDQRGHATIVIRDSEIMPLMERKTLISSTAVGSGTAGVLMPERVGSAVVPLAERRLFIRDVLPSRRITSNVAYFVKEASSADVCSPQTEGSDKAETEETFSATEAQVRTIATWIPATRQVLADFEGLLGFLQRKLVWSVKKEEETQVLCGDGIGLNLNGLITQATSFDTSLLSATDGWEKADVLRRAVQQVDVADETAAGFFVVHPNDWADIELTKDSNGRYISGGPDSPIPARLWRRPVIVTTAMSAGCFLAGSATSAEILDRQEVVIDISTEHSDYFVKNKVAIRAESRIALACYRPAAFIYGTFTTSPA